MFSSRNKKGRRKAKGTRHLTIFSPRLGRAGSDATGPMDKRRVAGRLAALRVSGPPPPCPPRLPVSYHPHRLCLTRSGIRIQMRSIRAGGQQRGRPARAPRVRGLGERHLRISRGRGSLSGTIWARPAVGRGEGPTPGPGNRFFHFLPRSDCGTLGKPLNLSVPQFPLPFEKW